jgi:hypothetical protein
MPLCAAINSGNIQPSSYDAVIGQINEYNDNKIIIKRRFVSSLCDTYVIENVVQKFNASVISVLPKDTWINNDIFACSGTLKRKRKEPLHLYPGTGGEEETVVEAENYVPLSFAYNVKSVVHDDRCGSGAELNSYLIRFYDWFHH